MAKANLTAVPARQSQDPYANSGNPLVDSGLVDSLYDMKAYANFLVQHWVHDPGDEPGDETQHGIVVATRVLHHALQTLYDIEAAPANGGAK